MVFGKVGRLVEVIRNILSHHQATEANQTSPHDPQTAFHGRYSPKFHFDFACAILIGSPVHQQLQLQTCLGGESSLRSFSGTRQITPISFPTKKMRA
jgi:hypothetical protein